MPSVAPVLEALESSGADPFAAWQELGRQLVARETRAVEAAEGAMRAQEEQLRAARALVEEEERALAVRAAALESARSKLTAVSRRVGEV